ncbi:hypothetical protein H8M03_04745 [Sphingomonas sabuli]|uniref:Peptidase n=1 Tax=Sphingomonas sabuli TaxID=2764186 RepID=A0A7G9L4T8_9SPHN|nr:hypothetical protein [Sphingomonas sabuli]QNM83637.1 hypothetical protein H8M03_04745 [Sphingomonas sabuli]
MRAARSAVAIALALLVPASAIAADPDATNPTCPKQLNWSTYRQMQFSVDTSSGQRVLKAEGQLDEDVPERLKEALAANAPIDEIWIRSPGGSARAGNAAGRIIREASLPTRVPAGWACFSACNFMFMGGPIRYVDAGAHFVVHMFTHVTDKDAIRAEAGRDADSAAALIGEIEQDSALLASEDNDFLIRMGVSRKLLTDVMYRQQAISGDDDRSTRRCLTAEETVKYNVANAQ